MARRGASNEYPQHVHVCIFSLRNKKGISSFWMKKVPYLLLCSVYFLPMAHSECSRPVFGISIHPVDSENANSDAFLAQNCVTEIGYGLTFG